LPQSEVLLSGLENVELLNMTRSNKKLRRGVHRANEFIITLYDVESGNAEINEKLESIRSIGFPNYFGAQRFGIDGRNVDHARSMFTSKRKLTRFKKSLYLSAARAWLFNKVLDARMDAGVWSQVLSGDVCMLNGTNSIFACDEPERGAAIATGRVQEMESTCLASEKLLCDGLENAGLKHERRALRALAGGLKWDWPDENTLKLSFSLQRGAYATSLLGEIVQLQQEYVK